MSGKDHFGWNVTTDSGITHGYNHVSVYDGLGDGLPDSNDTNGFDNYDQCEKYLAEWRNYGNEP